MPVQVNRDSRLDWDALRGRIRKHGMRNSNCLAIAPTATISNILGTTPCIEPVYKHIHTKSNLSGDFIRTTDPLIRDLMSLNLWDDALRAELKAHDGSIQHIERVPADLRRLYKTAFEIAPTWILQCAGVRQKWIDQAQSTNIWLAENDARTASFVYREAWERGLKTTYYLRTLNRSAIDSGHRDAPRAAAVPAAESAPSIRPAPTEAEKTACLVQHHLSVLLLGWAPAFFPPEDVLALPAVQVQQFLHKHVQCPRAVERGALLQRQKVHVVGAVDGVGHAVDGVRHWHPTPLEGHRSTSSTTADSVAALAQHSTPPADSVEGPTTPIDGSSNRHARRGNATSGRTRRTSHPWCSCSCHHS
jgi:hypothetical protein